MRRASIPCPQSFHTSRVLAAVQVTLLVLRTPSTFGRLSKFVHPRLFPTMRQPQRALVGKPLHMLPVRPFVSRIPKHPTTEFNAGERIQLQESMSILISSCTRVLLSIPNNAWTQPLGKSSLVGVAFVYLHARGTNTPAVPSHPLSNRST